MEEPGCIIGWLLVGRKIKSIEGVEDLYVGKVTGLPQINIKVQPRDKIGQYRMNVEDVNSAISQPVAGEVAGLVYESAGLRSGGQARQCFPRGYYTDEACLWYAPVGNKSPLSEVAEIQL